MRATVARFVWQGAISTENLDSAANVATLDYVLSIVSGPITPLLTSLVKKYLSGPFHGAHHLHKMLFWLETYIFI